ncbi:hypothetical protein [Feifania hominis]|uniref:Uncharacterized protein n=1 Tax=Feifania hominis TaxID=2763660 RepID=A0A926DE51_9FIRM|nr:hypothetical protein [Feifania hominis]
MKRSKLVETNEKIARTVTDTFGRIERAAVGGYTKIEDAFVERYLLHDGETLEQAKQRLKDAAAQQRLPRE